MTSGGVWEGSGGRWHSVGDVSYVCTAHCSDSYQLDVRLAKHFTVLHWEGYEYVPILISVHSAIPLHTHYVHVHIYMYTSLMSSSSNPCTGHVMITCSSCFYHMTSFNPVILTLFPFSSSDLETVFSTILSGHLSPSPKGDVISCLVQMAVQVHCQLSSLFLPSPERQHYLFNLRHIANLFRYSYVTTPYTCE